VHSTDVVLVVIWTVILLRVDILNCLLANLHIHVTIVSSTFLY